MQKTQEGHADSAEDRYLELYAGELEQSTKAGNMRGWYGHLKDGCGLQVAKVGSAQYTRDEVGKLLRKLDKIRERWRLYSTYLFNTILAALDRIIIEGPPPKLVARILGDPQVVHETKQALRSMANNKAMGLDELPVEVLTHGLSDSSH